MATGADGLIIEVHSDPNCALCDGPQSLRPSKFSQVMEELEKVATQLEEQCNTLK